MELERVEGAGVGIAEVAKDTVDHIGSNDDGDDLQLTSTRAQERVDLEDPAKETGPGATAGLEELACSESSMSPFWSGAFGVSVEGGAGRGAV